MTAPVENCFLNEVLNIVEDPFTYSAPDYWAIRGMDLRAVVREARVAASFGGQRATLIALADRALAIACESAAVVRDSLLADGFSMMQIAEQEEAELERYTPIYRKIRAMADAA